MLNIMDIVQRGGKYLVLPGVSIILGVEFSGPMCMTRSSGLSVVPSSKLKAQGHSYLDYMERTLNMLIKS